MKKDKKIKKILENQGYRFIGNHSAVKICRWTKNSIRNKGVCYKEKFYGIKSHLCCQMTCCTLCQNQCLHCWRAIELNLGTKMEKEGLDNPKKIISNSIEYQRELLSGFKGSKNKINLKKLKEAQNPNQFAISLSGEPTLYPKLNELIKELRKQKKTSFLVTNGLLPAVLSKLNKEKNLPTQLYISLNYPNEKLFRKITRNNNKNSWKKLNESLELMGKLKTRKVIRMTLVRNLNMEDSLIEEYSRLIKKASPDFLEIKGYMSIGFARERLGYDRMPNHEEIRKFARLLLEFLPKYKFLDEQIYSRVVLVGKSKKKMKIKEKEI